MTRATLRLFTVNALDDPDGKTRLPVRDEPRPVLNVSRVVRSKISSGVGVLC
jgi:hypothetical protein